MSREGREGHTSTHYRQDTRQIDGHGFLLPASTARSIFHAAVLLYHAVEVEIVCLCAVCAVCAVCAAAPAVADLNDLNLNERVDR